jgi:2-haloalkanoic acid dehalogenase type II
VTSVAGVFAGASVVTFDADETLWAFEIAMRHALAQTIELLRATHPDVAERWSVDELVALRDRIADEQGRAVTIAEVRRLSFVEALRTHDIDDPDLVASLTERYFHHRHGDVQLFDDVLPMIAALRPDLRLGLVTNGNTDPELSGLPGHFAFVLQADAVGVAKPDPHMFHLTIDTAGCAPDAIVHVGDSLTNDVEPAAAAGLRTVWINRNGRPLPRDATRPDATITSLLELPALLSGPC